MLVVSKLVVSMEMSLPEFSLIFPESSLGMFSLCKSGSSCLEISVKFRSEPRWYVVMTSPLLASGLTSEVSVVDGICGEVAEKFPKSSDDTSVLS